MNVKTKIFSLVILVLLFLPVVLNPQKSGQVLGATEENTSQQSKMPNFSLSKPNSTKSSSAQEEQPVNQSQITGEIASGVRSTSVTENTQTSIPYSGKAIVNMNTSLIATSDKFPIGTSVRLTNGDKVINIVIQGKSILSADTLVVVNKDIFEKIGGDLAKGSIEITAYTN